MKRKVKLNADINLFFSLALINLIGLFGLFVLIYIGITNLKLIGGLLFVGLLITTILLFIFGRRHVYQDLISFSLDFSAFQKTVLKNLPLPYCLLDGEGKVIWYNRSFSALFLGKKIKNQGIQTILPLFENDPVETIVESTQRQCVIDGQYYNVFIEKVKVKADETLIAEMGNNSILYTISLFDISEEVALKKSLDEHINVIGFIYIDNYEELIKGIEDIKRSLFTGSIDSAIQTMAKNIDGVVRKYERDKYILFFPKKHLETLKNSKFDILDEVRKISMGNDVPVTLSMGLGVDRNSYTQSLEYARYALDLAQGRGGDQAVLKDDDKHLFYGGKTRAVESSSRVKARIKAFAFKELIQNSDRVIIMGHRGADLDSLGAAVGVYRCAQLCEKPANIVLRDVNTTIKTLYDDLVNSKKYPNDLFVNGFDAINLATKDTLLVIVDVNRTTFLDSPELLSYIKKVAVFDHHRVTIEQIENPVLSYVEPYASSTCEMVTELLRYIHDRPKLETIEADAILAGITVDTKNFVIKAGVKTFEAAAFLKRNGADLIRIRAYFKNDMEAFKAKAAAVKDSELYHKSMAIAVSPSNVTNPTVVAAQAADELLNIQGVRASFVMTEKDDMIYISARSLDEINVQLIMEKLGGGGHLSVAGAQIVNSTIDDVKRILKEKIDEYFEEGEQ